MMSTWSDRMKSRMKELGITQEALAAKMGVTRGAVTHYLSGRRQPPLHQFKKIAIILKTDPAWLQFGTIVTSTSLAITSKQPEKSHFFPLPILSWDQVADFKDSTKLNKEEIIGFVPHFFTDKPNLYALRIKGDAMTAPISHVKSFHDGELIIVDSEKQISNGDFVIAVLPRSKEVTFKQYVVDSGSQYLKPLNPQYPILTIDKGTFICGVVIHRLS